LHSHDMKRGNALNGVTCIEMTSDITQLFHFFVARM
jgi:hypothetical protein